MGLHRWRVPMRHDASTFARCTTCRHPVLFRRRPAPMI
jgi:DNA-directed RNA polymerase subunit RPC12/RpoP